MSYRNEINFIQNKSSISTKALEIIEILLKNPSNKVTSLIDIGNEYDWVGVASDEKGFKKVERILLEKARLGEWIGISVFNSSIDRFLAIDMSEYYISFELDISRVSSLV